MSNQAKKRPYTVIKINDGTLRLVRKYRVRRIRGRTLPQKPFHVFFRDTGMTDVCGYARSAEEAHAIHLRNVRELKRERRQRRKKGAR